MSGLVSLVSTEKTLNGQWFTGLKTSFKVVIVFYLYKGYIKGIVHASIFKE